MASRMPQCKIDLPIGLYTMTAEPSGQYPEYRRPLFRVTVEKSAYHQQSDGLWHPPKTARDNLYSKVSEGAILYAEYNHPQTEKTI
jgi:hypothetical protein